MTDTACVTEKADRDDSPDRRKTGRKGTWQKATHMTPARYRCWRDCEAVRKRPGMYIGSVSRKGLNHLIYEIVDNAVDEHLAGYCTEIEVTLEKDGKCDGTG